MMYTNLNINDFLKDSSEGEILLDNLLAGFSCPINKDVEQFLLNNSKSSTKKGQSATYCVVDNDTELLVGYFTLAIRPISVPVDCISKTAAKKLSRISDYDEMTNTHTLSAYLIAQIGKNFTLDIEDRISGKVLLSLATEQILKIRNLAGGVVIFLECENNQKLIDFYTKNGFMPFNNRTTQGSNPRQLNQLLRFI